MNEKILIYNVNIDKDKEPTYSESHDKSLKTDKIYFVLSFEYKKFWIWMGNKANKKHYAIAQKLAKKLQAEIDFKGAQLDKVNEGREPKNFPKI